MKQHGRERYIANNEENRAKLVDHIIKNADHDELEKLARRGLTNHYIDEDQHFIDDYYQTFEDEDPDEVSEEKKWSVVYYHGHHSNPCVVGEIHLPVVYLCGSVGYNVIIITHNRVCEEYGDNLCDITKVWDAQVHSEVFGSLDTEPDLCISIPIDIGEHTSLANMLLKQILIDNDVKTVVLSSENKLTLEDFYKVLDS